MKLLVIADLTGSPQGDKVLLSKKFVTGMQMYADHWDGELHAALQPAELDRENLDVREWDISTLGFGLKLMRFDDGAFRQWVRDLAPDVVMGGANHLLMDIVGLCEQIGARFVCCTEYNLRTNFQIIQARDGSPLSKAKSAAWMAKHMWERRRMVRRSAGLQANGTPTFEEYLGENDNALLYFDSRIRPDMIVTDEERAARLRRVTERREPLRLLFSGRLNRMKGADHLVDVASELRDRGVAFQLDLCGDGTEREAMQRRVASLGLEPQVRFRGVLDFETELVPYARKEIDVFVCCHRQGDPSCTYLETAACGVPIMGYDNQAFEGILRRYRIGQASPMNDPAALARQIKNVLVTPRIFADYVSECVRFAEENTYDRVFAQRIDHLRSVAAG